MITIEQPEQNVHVADIGGKIVYIVGTAHISSQSAELTKRIIQLVRPSAVCVELCEARYQSLQNPDRWRDTDVFEIIRSGRAYVLMAQLVLAAYQKRLADQLNIRPGEEMHTAIAAAHNIGASIVPVDRDIKITLKRAWGNSGIWSLTKIFGSLIASLFSSEEFSSEDIERLKENDALTVVMSELSEHLPEAKRALVDERDSYLAKKIVETPGDRIVAIVGAGHVPGLLKQLDAKIDLSVLETVPKRQRFFVVLSWAIPVLVFFLVGFGFWYSGWETMQQMAVVWWLANGTLSALGAMLAFAHPLTILTAFFAAPITSLNPTIAAGWVCGLVEVVMRKPRVSDLEQISEQITSVKGIFQNRVTRVLLVVVFANLGSVLGTILGVGKIVSLL